MTTDQQIISEFEEKFQCRKHKKECPINCDIGITIAFAKSFLLFALARVRDEEMGLVVSLTKQVQDLRASAREYARKDLLSEIRDGIKGHVVADNRECEMCYLDDVLDLLDSYDQK